MTEICVVHLVWRPFGTEMFGRFLAAYDANRSSVPHDLAVLYNGFEDEACLAPFLELEAGRARHRLVYPGGLDLNLYFAAGRQLEYRTLCFLNSYSRVLDPNWLDIYRSHIGREGVGIVGATGSYQSCYSDAVAAEPTLTPRQRVVNALLLRQWRTKCGFPPFPNPHVRTNGFMMERETMLRIRTGPLTTRKQTLRLESGWQSITRQVEAMGLRPLVLGRNGDAYEKEGWWRSGTFRQGEQENLLVTDNRTDHYAQAGPAARAELLRQTWGEHAGGPGGSAATDMWAKGFVGCGNRVSDGG